jgi:hypothetical protein
MKSVIFSCLFFGALGVASLTKAQDSDKAVDDALRQAAEAAKKMGATMPDVKKLMEEDAQEEIKEKAKVQAAVDAPGPVAFPVWTPQVPEFTPAGPLAKKIVNEQPMVVQTGTSPLTPGAIADAWEKFKNDKYSLGRTDSNVNGTVTQIVNYRDLDDAKQEVTMKAERGPRENVTRVTISAPLP